VEGGGEVSKEDSGEVSKESGEVLALSLESIISIYHLKLNQLHHHVNKLHRFAGKTFCLRK
jgi:hypothetical protein